MTRISRDAYGLRLAEAAALRADCTRRQVGAVIVAEDGSIVSTGYNGLASGRPGCLSAGACPRGQMAYPSEQADETGTPNVAAGQHYEATGCRAVHAEVNAIIRAGRDRCVGATIYVTDEPCFHCSVVIEGAGLARTVTPGNVGIPGIHQEEGRTEWATAIRERQAGNVPATVPAPSAATPAPTEDEWEPDGTVRDAELPGMWERADFFGGAPDVVRTSGPLDPEIHAALVRAVERARARVGGRIAPASNAEGAS